MRLTRSRQEHDPAASAADGSDATTTPPTEVEAIDEMIQGGLAGNPAPPVPAPPGSATRRGDRGRHDSSRPDRRSGRRDRDRTEDRRSSGTGRGAYDEEERTEEQRIADEKQREELLEAAAGMRHSGRPLGELLIDKGLITEEQLQEALTQQKASGKKLGHILVQLKMLKERSLTDVLAEQLGLPLVDLSRTEIDPEVVALLSEDDARRLSALPTHRDGTRIEVAVADPRAGQAPALPDPTRRYGPNRLDEVVDVGVQGRVVAARSRREPAAERRELERLREVPQRQPVRAQLIFERGSVDARLNARRAEVASTSIT